MVLKTGGDDGFSLLPTFQGEVESLIIFDLMIVNH